VQLSALQSLASSVAQGRPPDQVLQEVVRGLGMTEGVALARVWVVEQEGVELVLRLRASVGLSRINPDELWNRLDGPHARLPLTYGKVGHVASTAEPLLLHQGPPDWLLEAEWANREGIESFAAQPIVFRQTVFGVVAVFSRRRWDRTDLGWLRAFADQAAIALANHRAFGELAELRHHAERGPAPTTGEVAPPESSSTELVAHSHAMKELLFQVNAVAKTLTTVLITGESGVGKELIANAIHQQSGRGRAALVKVNCASVPRELFESEFFGHVRGAFSGAARDREGRFQLADGGTLFLDEVGEIPLELQGKLLRVLQEQEFEPVGDDRTRRVDVRVIAATNRDLQRDVDAGLFRRDLFYRLSVLPLHVPALRDRTPDIVPLVEHFVIGGARRFGIPVPALAPRTLQELEGYNYPGNVRELRNLVERALVLWQPNEPYLNIKLPSGRPDGPPSSERVSTIHSSVPPSNIPDVPPLPRVLTEREFRTLERQNIEAALRQCGGKIAGASGAAKLLGLSPSTLAYRMKVLGVKP
jgi:transcriptional regulator with GAF, ATPase, and Fis domain